VRYYNAFTRFPTLKFPHRTARFRQLNTDKPHVHHDALEFPSGDSVLLTRLCEGQRATVLQLPAGPHAVHEAKERTDASLLV